MKKTIGALLSSVLIFLTLTACAQDYYSIEELREQAKGGWHKTYTAYGRVIEADIEANVPDVDAAPVLKVGFARVAAPRGDEAYGRYYYLLPDSNVYGYALTGLTKERKTKEGPQKYYVQPRELNRVYPDGESLTLGKAIDVVKSTLKSEQFNLDDFFIEYPYEMTTITDYDAITGKQALPGTYRMWFYTLLDSIPVLAHDGQCYKKKTFGWYMPGVDAGVCSENYYSVSVRTLDITERLAEDIPLCSFSSVLKAIESEIDAGHIRKVYRLEFGYILYDDPEYTSGDEWNDGHYYAVPAWRLSCLYMSDRQKELPEYNTEDEGMEHNSLEYSALVINAQTGEMEDFMSRDKKRTHYKGFFTWDQVK